MPLYGALFIFLARIGDVSVGTLRVVHTVRGNRWIAAALALVEAGIWIVAVRQVFNQLDNYWNVVGYAAGFSTGTFVGITLERWIASGWIIARIISRDAPEVIRNTLLQHNFGATTVRGEGRDGDVLILFVVAPRRRGRQLLDIVRVADPDAFVTVDPVSSATGGHLPAIASASVRK